MNRLSDRSSVPSMPSIAIADPTPWADDAACAGQDTELWFSGPAQTHITEAAKTICRGCSVVGACLEWALPQTDLWGVFGGLTRKDRQRLRRQG